MPTETGDAIGADADRSDRRANRSRRRRRWALGIAVVIVGLLTPVSVSYVGALTGPGHDSWKARSVEWMREHHLGKVVDTAERHWFASHQAKMGGSVDPAAAGPQLARRPTVPTTTTPVDETTTTTAAPTTTVVATTASSAPTSTAISTTTTTTSEAVRLSPPGALTSPASPTFPGEGQWQPFGPLVGGQPGAYATTLRPDAVHTSSVVGVVWFDPHALSFRQFPGTKIPGRPWDRPPHVPKDLQAHLVAAFSGGFRINDSHGGMWLAGHELRPMRAGAATFAIDTSGVPLIGAWGVDVSLADTLDSARQNLDLIVSGGAVNVALATDPNRTWGFTGPANKSFVWRSGAGVRADGSIVWVGGPGLSIETLAAMFVRLGAVRAMQLDINREWMQFNSYSVGSDGKVHGQRLLAGMRGPDDRWLSTDTRDFVAVFARS